MSYTSNNINANTGNTNNNNNNNNNNNTTNSFNNTDTNNTPNTITPIVISDLTQRVYNHFLDKYPRIFPASGIDENGIHKLVTKSLTLKQSNSNTSGYKFGSRDDIRTKINNLVSLLESKLKTEMYKGTRIGTQPNTSKFTTDPLIEIPYTSYANQSPSDMIIKKTTNTTNTLNTPNTPNTPNNDYNDEYDTEYDNTSDNIYNTLYDRDYKDPLTKAIINDGGASGSDRDLDANGHAISTLNQAHNKLIASGSAKNITYVEDREFTYYVAIDSKDRNRTRNTQPNEFVIDFSPSGGADGSNGYINVSFGNIISCELLNAVILDTTTETDSTDSTVNGTPIPYIILELPELEKRIEGTNEALSKAFAILSDYSIKNGYKHYNVNTNQIDPQARVIFNPRRSISRLTIRVLQPDGTLFDFGDENNENTKTVIHLLLKLTTLQKNLGTNYVGQAFN